MQRLPTVLLSSTRPARRASRLPFPFRTTSLTSSPAPPQASRACQRTTRLSTIPTGHQTSPMQRFVLKVTRTTKDGQLLNEVSSDTMDKANSRFRIGLMTAMMLFCVAGSAYSISRGKKAARVHHESIHQQNMDRHANFKR